MCLCGDIFSQYKENNCRDVGGKDKELCTRLYQQLDHTNPACLCPVDSSKGKCGIPVHMDLVSSKLSGLRVPLLPVKNALLKDTSNVVIKGLEKHPSLHKWVLASANKHTRVSSDSSHLEWSDRIPNWFGKKLRAECSILTWSVTRNVETSAGWKVAHINFSGLTYNNGRRRLKMAKTKFRNC